MDIKEIQQSITMLSPDELARFRAWFRKYESNVKSGDGNDSKPPIEDVLKKARGSLKGTGVLQSLMEERRKGK